MQIRSLGTLTPTVAAPRAAARPVLEESGPQESVTLSGAPEQKPAAPSRSAHANAKFAAQPGVWGSIMGGLHSAALWVASPVKTLLHTKDFARNFAGELRTRAEEITRDPAAVEEHLKTKGMHEPYQEPQHKTNVKLEGEMTIKATMGEFFDMWASWIEHGYGSINDRQYADIIMKYRDAARDNPLLAYIPITSVDSFTADIKDGKMMTMTESTVEKFAGLFQSSKVDWTYRRGEGTPRASNSFERSIDRCGGDLAKVEQFYNETFDPQKVNPNSKATVEFRVRAVQDLPELPPSSNEFEHKVKLPLPGLFPHPASTFVPGPAGVVLAPNL